MSPLPPDNHVHSQFSYDRKPQSSMLEACARAVELGIPAPAFNTALTYFDGYRTARLPANLLQAQRDYFGAHTFERTDKPGIFHADWLGKRRTPK